MYEKPSTLTLPHRGQFPLRKNSSMSLGLVDAPASTHSWGCKRSERLLGTLAAAGWTGCSSFGLHGSLVLLLSSWPVAIYELQA